MAANLCFYLSFVGFIASSYATPPQTPVQKQVLARALAEAQPASKQAESDVLQLFDSEITRKYLKQFDDGSALYNLTATELVGKFWSAISAAEIVHSFGDSNPHAANCGYDMNIVIGEESPFFYNQWQLQALKYVDVDTKNNLFTEGSETKLFGYPPFKNVSAPDISTANDRIVYGAVNMFRGSGGNPQCGPISAVFKRSYISDANFLVAPFDTGFFTGTCNGSIIGDMGNESVGKCSAWGESHTLGNPPYLSHLVRPYLTYWNESEREVGAEYVNLNLARLLTRLLSPYTYSDKGLALNFVENTLGYFEYNLAIEVEIPQGIKMMIGMFELLWGTYEGNYLRSWCASKGWVLVWAYNPLMSFWRCGPDGQFPGCSYPSSLTQGIDITNVRILDPIVLNQVPAGHNVTISPEVIQSFQSSWQSFNASAASKAQLQEAWRATSANFSDFLAQPLFPGACANADCAAVLLGSGACVC